MKKRKIKFEINNLLFKQQENDDAAAGSQPPLIQTPPSFQMYGNTNTNLASILLDEPWLVIWFIYKIHEFRYIK